MPRDEAVPEPEEAEGGGWIYKFPKHCSFPQTPVSLGRLAVVIGLAVSAICIWGTLVGSMLPIFFRTVGVDPGIASSPFVATFVDVTGIILYFNIAQIFLL